jgi:aminoglycoside phosphotransferase (APT) family kinase protein
MPIPEQRDLAAARADIRDWLAKKLPERTDLTISELSGPAFTGFSNETLLFDAIWTEDGAEQREGLVLRVEPTRHHLFLDPDFEIQYKVIDTLGRNSDVPVAPMRWYEDDTSILGAAFFVMSKVEGRVPQDSPPYTQEGWLLEDSTPDERRTLVRSGIEALAKVHAVDWRALGFDFLDKTQYGPAGLEQQLNYYEAYLRWAMDGAPNPVADAALEWLRANRPEEQELALIWGDARINNQIFDDHTVAAVVDWEMVTIADPMMDVGWWLFLDRHFHEGMPADRMEGFPTREEMVEHYEQVSGRKTHDLRYYEVLAGLKFTIIMAKLMGLLVEFEILPVDTDMGLNNIPSRLTAALLGLPSPGPEPVPVVD